jgi:hypothetical protein
MPKLIRHLIALVSLCVHAATAAAVEFKEKPGGKDHPLVSRYPGSVLYNYGLENYTQARINLGGPVKFDYDKKSYEFKKASEVESVDTDHHFAYVVALV